MDCFIEKPIATAHMKFWWSMGKILIIFASAFISYLQLPLGQPILSLYIDKYVFL